MASSSSHQRSRRRQHVDTSLSTLASSSSDDYSYDSRSTAPTSHHSSSRSPTAGKMATTAAAAAAGLTYSYTPPPPSQPRPQLHSREQQQQQPPPPPSPSRKEAAAADAAQPSASTSSVLTYDSAFSDETDEDLADEEDTTAKGRDGQDDALDLYDPEQNAFLPPSAGDAIPAMLPPYRASLPDPSARASTPEAFGQLFPSLDRLSVRHDELTADGNMNLRVDTLAQGPRRGSSSSSGGGGGGGGTRLFPVQLFHLRMHDLARRDFSLRRYCRDSGREVCSSKREYVAPAAGPMSMSMSSAIRSVRSPFRRSSGDRRSRAGSGSGDGSNPDASAPASPWSSRRPSVSSASSDRPSPGSLNDAMMASAAAGAAAVPQHLVPTQTIKLEFSNYAHVDVTRRAKGYAFEWWGHRYVWRRVVDANLEGRPVSFHLLRDAHGPAVAHLVPETRSPSQVDAQEAAGGWIPPCFMWISDRSILSARTDVAEYVIPSPPPFYTSLPPIYMMRNSTRTDRCTPQRHRRHRPRRPRRRLHQGPLAPQEVAPLPQQQPPPPPAAPPGVVPRRRPHRRRLPRLRPVLGPHHHEGHLQPQALGAAPAQPPAPRADRGRLLNRPAGA